MDQFPQMAPAGNPALQSQLEAQVGFFNTLSLRAVDTLQRVNELNMQLARQLLDNGFATCRAMLACRDPAQAAAVAMHGLQPSGERLRDYQQSLFGVMARAQADLPSSVAAPAAPPAGRG